MRQRASSRTNHKLPTEAAMAPSEFMPAASIAEALASQLLDVGEKSCADLRNVCQRELLELHDIKNKLLEQVYTTRKSTKRKLNSIYEDETENQSNKKQSLEKVTVENDKSIIEHKQEMSSEVNKVVEPLKQIDNIIMPPPSVPVKTRNKRATSKVAVDVETTVVRKSRRTRTIAQTIEEEVNTTVTRLTRSSSRINSSKIVENEDEQNETINTTTTTKKTRGKTKNVTKADVTIKKEKIEDEDAIAPHEVINKDAKTTKDVEVPAVDKDSTLVADVVVETMEVDGHVTITDSQETIVDKPSDDMKEKPNNKLTIVFDNNINENSMINLENNGNTSTPDKPGSDKETEMDAVVIEKKNVTIDKKKALDATVVLEKSPTENTNKAELPIVLDETMVISGKIEQKASKDNQNDSVLSEDLSEVEETPPKVVLPKVIPINKNTVQVFESPVKSRVKHFEKLAEIANAKSAQAIQNGLKNTRTRSNIKKPSKVDLKVSAEIEKPTTKTIVKCTPNNLKKVVKPIVPAPSKQVGSATKYGSTSSVNKLLSPRSVPISQSGTQAAAKAKQDAYNKKIEGMKKKRDEELRILEQKSKEAVEKAKAAQEQRRLKEEEMKKQKEIRRQEETTEKALKKAIKDNELALKKMEQAANKTYDLNTTTVLKSHARVSNFITQPNKAFDEMMKCDEALEEKNASDKERKKTIELRKPLWAKKENLDPILRYQKYVKIHVRDTLYSTSVFSPDLSQIFPNIDRSKLKRTSSAVWKTPPRCSMMPRL